MSRHPADLHVGHPERDEWEASEADHEKRALARDRFGADAIAEADAFRRMHTPTTVEVAIACILCGAPAVAERTVTPQLYAPARVSTGYLDSCDCWATLRHGPRDVRDRRAAWAYDRNMTAAAFAALEGR